MAVCAADTTVLTRTRVSMTVMLPSPVRSSDSRPGWRMRENTMTGKSDQTIAMHAAISAERKNIECGTRVQIQPKQ